MIVAVLQGLQGTGGYGTDAELRRRAQRQQHRRHRQLRADRLEGQGAGQRDAAAWWRACAPNPTWVPAGTEAAREFDCPRVGSGHYLERIADPAQANFIAGGDPSEVGSRIDELISRSAPSNQGSPTRR